MLIKRKINLQDELGELTESINHMADSLQSMLEAKRQLLMAISHELRTPITKAKLRMEFMPESNEKAQLKPYAYKENHHKQQSLQTEDTSIGLLLRQAPFCTYN